MICSPISTLMVLSLLSFEAVGKTKTELRTVLRLPQDAPTRIGFRFLMQQLSVSLNWNIFLQILIILVLLIPWIVILTWRLISGFRKFNMSDFFFNDYLRNYFFKELFSCGFFCVMQFECERKKFSIWKIEKNILSKKI